MPQRYSPKIEIIEAVQWLETNEKEMIEFVGHNFEWVDPDDRDDAEATGAVLTSINSAWKNVYYGDWVTKDARGSIGLVDGSRFYSVYELA